MEEEEKLRYEEIINRLKNENQSLHRRIINMKSEPNNQGLIIGKAIVDIYVRDLGVICGLFGCFFGGMGSVYRGEGLFGKVGLGWGTVVPVWSGLSLVRSCDF